jgi:hypothetical protein
MSEIRIPVKTGRAFDDYLTPAERAIVEKRLTHAPDPVLARHAANLSLISGPSGLRPDLDVAEGQPIAGILAAMVAFDGVARIGPVPEPMVILPSLA